MENTIKIHLKEKDNYINTYNEKILSYDLSNYILEELKGISVDQNIEFVISSDFVLSDKEKDDLVGMMRNSFGADISETINLSKKQFLANYLILFIGIIFFIMYYLLKIDFFSEFALIIGWIFIGEAICNLLYKGIENKFKISRRKQIVNAKVTFK